MGLGRQKLWPVYRASVVSHAGKLASALAMVAVLSAAQGCKGGGGGPAANTVPGRNTTTTNSDSSGGSGGSDVTMSVSAPSVNTVGATGTVTFTVTYGGASSISLSASSVSLTVITGNPTCSKAVTGSGTVTRTITLSGCSGNGSLQMFIASGTASNTTSTATAWGPSGALNVDTSSPTINSVTSSSTNGTYIAGQTISIQVTFSKAVTVTGTPQLTLETGTTDAVVNYTSGSGTSTLTFNYTVAAGHNSLDLDYVSTSALALNGGTIKDSIGNNATLTLASPGGGGSLSWSKDLVVDALGPTVTNVTSSTSNGSYKAGQTVSIQVTFSEVAVVTGTPQLTLETGASDAVVNYVSGSGTTTLTFTYTVGAGHTSSDLDYQSTTALALNGGTIKDALGNIATLTLPSPGAAGSLGANKNIIIDTTAPTVTNVTSSTANGSYKAGQAISIQVTFSEVVNVTGTPQLTLETGASDAVVNYSSGSGTNTLTFTYTVGAGHTSADLDYQSTTALALNGGTIQDAATNNATLTLVAPGTAGSLGANKNIVIDTTAPTVTNVTSSTANGTYKAGQSVSIQVNFSEVVTVTGTPQLTLETGASDAVVNYASGSGTNTLTFTYTIGATETSADLDYQSTTALALNGGTIQDAATNNATLTLVAPGAAGSLGANKNIVIDTTPPTVTNVTSSTANGTYKAGQTVSIQVVFSETVTVTGTPQLTLATGGAGTAVNYVSGSGSTTLNFTYTVSAGHNSADLDFQSTTALALNGGTIQDAATNNATLTLVAPGTAGSLGANKNIVIDTTAPTVTNVTSSTANGSYKAAQTVSIQVTFSEAVTVTGTPQLTLETGASDAVVNYASGSGTTTLTFTYTIGAGHTSADLDFQSTTALALNGGTIADAVGNAATLTLPTPGAAGSLGANKNIVIDTTAPTVTNVTSSTADGSYVTGQSISIQVVFSEAVTVTGTPQLTLETGATDAVVNYTSGSGTNSLTFTYTIGAAHTTTDLDYQSTTALALNSGTIADAAGNNATLTLAAPGAATSLGANKAIGINLAVGDAATSTVTASASAVNADASSTGTITVTIKDNGSNPIPGKTVSLASNRGATDTISPASVATDGSGVATFTVTSGTTGSPVFTATDTSDGVTVTQTASLTFVGVNLEVPIDFLSGGGAGSSTSAVAFGRSRFSLNTTDYDGTVTYSFEIIATNTDSASKDVLLIDASGATVATNTVTTAASVPTRLRVSFTPNVGSDVYRIKLPATTSAGQVNVANARVLIKQVNATQTKLYIPLMAGAYSGGSQNDDFNPVTFSVANSYAANSGYMSMWHKDTSRYATLSGATPYTFEASMQGSTGFASLFDKTTGNQVTASELSSSTATFGLYSVSFADNATNFNNLDDFEVRIKSTSGAAYVNQAALWIKLKNLSKGESYYRIQQKETWNCTTLDSQRVLLDTTLFSNPTVYHESTSSQISAGTAALRVYQNQNNDSGTTGAYLVPNSSITVPASVGLLRSSAMTITPGDRFLSNANCTTGAESVANSFLVTAFNNSADTTAPVVTYVTSGSANGSFGLGQVIPIQVKFSENVIVTGTPQLTLETGASDAVLNYASGSGTNTLTFNYTVAAGHTSADLDYQSTTALALNGGTIKDAAGNSATLTLAALGTAGSLGNSKDLVIDTTAPTVSNVTSSTANGTYGTGQAVSIQVTFSKAVTVTGTPQLTLETGASDAVVNYASGSGTTSLTFTYTIGAGHTSADLDYQSTTALALNGGTIKDAAGNNATITLAAPGAAGSLGANKNIAVDTTAPTVTNVTSSTADGSYKSGQTISIQVVFSKTVTVTGTPQLTLETGASDAVVNYASGSGTNTLTFTYTVGAGETSADLDYQSTAALALNGGTIKDAATNNATLTLVAPGAAGSLGANKAIVIDTTAPTVTNVTSSTADGSYKSGQTVSIQVVFSEAVTVTGTPQLTLETGASDAVVNYASGSGTNTLTFNYTVGAGHTSADLDYQSTTALALNSGTIQDAATNNATLTLVAPGAAGSLGANKAIVIDTTAPTVTNVTSSTADGSYVTGQSVSIQVVFSEAVTVTGTPQLTLETGATDAVVNYSSGSGTNTLTFTYIIGAAHTSSDLDYQSTGALALNSGTINDAAGNSATLTLAAPGAATSLGANKAIGINSAVGDAATSTVTASASTVNADTAGTGTITVTIKDNSSNPISGKTVTLASSRGATDTISPASAVTDGSGVATFTVTSGTTGSPVFTATDTTDSVTVTQTASLTFVGVNLEVPIDFLSGGGAASSTTATTFERSRFSLNTNDYNGTVTYSFEIVAVNTDSMSKDVLLLDSSGATVATNTVATSAATPTLMRVSFTPNSGPDTYRIKTPATTSSGQVKVSAARVMIKQVNATQTKLFIPLLSGGFSGATAGDSFTPATFTASTTYVSSAGEMSNWHKDTSRYATLSGATPYTLEAVISGGGTNGYVSLFNKSSGNQVTASEISGTGALGLQSVSFADNAANFTNLDDFEIRIKSQSGGNIFVNQAALWIKLKNLSKGESYYRINQVENYQCSTMNSQRVLLDSTLFSNPTIYHEATSYQTAAGTQAIRIYQNQSNDSGTTGATLVAGSSISVPVSAGVSRTSAITITPGDRYITNTNCSTGGERLIDNFLVAAFNNSADTTAPVVTYVTSSATNGSYGLGQVIPVQVKFSENVIVTGTPQLTLETGASDAVLNYTSGSGTNTLTFNYTVAAGHTSADLDYQSTTALALNGGTIQDAAGNNATLTLATVGAAGSLGSSKDLVIDTTAPTVSNVTSSTANGTYGTGQAVSIQVTFSKAVTVTGTPQLTLETGASDAVVNYASGSGTTTLTFTYTVAAGHASADLDYQSTTALALNGGTIKDAAGNSATLTLAAPGAAGSLGANKNIVIDAVAPTVSNVTSSTNNGTYASGQSISVQVVFSKSVTVTGTPQLTLASGGAGTAVNYASGSGSTTLTFTYTIGVSDSTSDLDYSSTTALALNGGTIVDTNNNSATLTLAAPGAAGSLGANKDIVITTSPLPYTSGLLVWLDANAITGVANNAAVPTWYDQSGNATNGAQATVGKQPIYKTSVVNGKPVLDFSYTGPQYYDFSNFLSGKTAAQIFMVAKAKNFPPGNSASGLWNFGTNVNNSHYSWSDGVIYDAFGSTTRQSFTPAYPLSQFNIYSVSSKSGGWTAWLNGVQQYTTGTNTVGFASAPRFGSGVSNELYNMDAQVAEVIIYDNELSAPNRQAIESYLATKYALDITAPTVTNVTSSTGNATYRAGQTVSIQVTFSEAVTVTGTPQLTLETGASDAVVNYASGSGTSTLTFTYTIGAGHTSSDLDYQSTTALSLNGGTIKDASGNAAVLTLASPGAAGSLGANKNIVIDTTAPTVTNVTSSTADGSYRVGQTVSIQVTFSESVTVTGTPQLTLETGASDAVVNYVSGSSTNTLTFTYTIGAGHTSSDLDYQSTGALALNGGTIMDAGGNSATLTLPSPGAAGSLGANKNIIIDTAAPSVTNVTSSTADGSYKAGQAISIQVTFSEAVTVTGTPQLTLETGASDAVVNYASGSGTTSLTFTYTIGAGDTSSDLDYQSTTALALNSGTIKDAAGNAATLTLVAPGAAGSLGANKAIVVDTTAPTVTNVTSSTADGTYTTGQSISIQVVFSESVTVTGTPQLTLETGASDAVVNYASGSGSNTLTFTYTVGAGESSSDLDYQSTTALALNGGTIQDAATNSAVLTLVSPGAAGSLGANKALVVSSAALTGDANRSQCRAIAGSVINNNSTTSTVTVTIMNSSSTLVSGKTVSISSSRGGTDTISPASAVTNGSGVATFTIKSATTGLATITCTDSTDSVTLSERGSVLFLVASPWSEYRSTLPNGATFASGNSLTTNWKDIATSSTAKDGALTNLTNTANYSYAGTVLADSPMAFWRLGESSGTTAYDVSGNSRDLTFFGGYTQGVAGALANDPDTSTTFNGTTGYAKTAAANTFAFGNTTFTVEFWVKSTTASSTWIISNGSSSTGWAIGFSSGKVRSFVKNCLSHQVSRSSNTTVNDGSWHHIGFVITTNTTVEVSNDIQIYVDGALDQTAISYPGDGPYCYPNATHAFGIGARSVVTTPDNYWAGTVDDVAVYPRALTPTQIAAHYAARTSNWIGHGTSTGPYALRLDGTNDYVGFGTGVNSNSSFSFDTWINPLSSSTKGTVILTNGETANSGLSNEANLGMTLRQSKTKAGVIDLMLGAKTYADEVLADSPVGYWRLGENSGTTAFDSSGNSNNGSYVGGYTLAQSGALLGDADTSITMDGVTGEVAVPDASNLRFANASNISLEAWVYSTDLSDYRTIIAKGRTNGSNDANYILRTGQSNGRIEFYYRDGTNWNVWSSAPSVIATNAWYHVAVTYTFGTGSSLAVYVNGVAITGGGSWVLGNGNGTVVSSTNPLWIGRINEPGATEPLIGKIDEVAVFNTILSPTRIAAHYYAGLNRVTCSSKGTLTNSAWHHVSGTFDSTGPTLKMFVNGTQECSVTAAGSAYTGSANALKAGADSTPANFWSGFLAELRTYSSALGSSDVSSVETKTRASYADPYQTVVLADSPLGYWRLDETSGTTATNLGSLGSSGNGTYSAGVTLNQTGAMPSSTNSAISLDGNTQSLTLPSAVLSAVTGNVTFEMWINPTSINNYQVVFDTVSRHMSLFIGQGFYAVGGGGSGISYSTAFTTGAWQHVAVTRSGSDVTIYRNGLVVATATDANSVFSDAIQLGPNPSLGGIVYVGKYDEIAIYSTALSPERIWTHYQTGIRP